jgi:hypothetical protein
MGTSLERIAPESLTRDVTGFVHGHMSIGGNAEAQDQVSMALN